jgi:hypothetical protein
MKECKGTLVFQQELHNDTDVYKCNVCGEYYSCKVLNHGNKCGTYIKPIEKAEPILTWENIKLEYNKVLAKFLGINVEEYSYKHWGYSVLGILDEDGEFKEDYYGATQQFDASMDWNILIKAKYELTQFFDIDELEKCKPFLNKFNFAVLTNRPEEAFKSLAEYIKENNLSTIG